MAEQASGHGKTPAENGIKVVEPSDELKALFQRLGETMAAEWVKGNGEAGQAMLDAYMNR